MTDEPKRSTKPIPAYRLAKIKATEERRVRPARPGQKDRKQAIGNKLKKMNIHMPVGARTKANLQKLEELKEFLRETWLRVMPHADNFKRFSKKQIAFARHYAKNGRSNRAEAMRLAGYDTNDPQVLWHMGRRNMNVPFMEELIQAFELEEKVRMKINVEDVVKWFNDIAMAAMSSGDFTNANRAMENLAKYLGMFVEKKEIVHKTVHSKEELDSRIAELTAILREAEPEIERKLRIN